MSQFDILLAAKVQVKTVRMHILIRTFVARKGTLR